MPPVGFEPTIPAIERLQTHALDPAATGTGTGGYQNKNKRMQSLCIFAQHTVVNSSAVSV